MIRNTEEQAAMAKIAEFKKPPPRTDAAEIVLPKLAAARERLLELEDQVNAAALSAALEELGASGRLTKANADLEAARQHVDELERAYKLAEAKDAMARAELDAKGRREQLAVMRSRADARLAAIEECCTAIETASKSYARFLNETDAMARALPLGTISH
jgi:hypothetical protein